MKNDDEKGVGAEIERGTQDDLEVLKLIIQSNAGLEKRVFEKLRSVRSLTGETFQEAVMKKQDKKLKGRRNRGGKPE
ncbi:MAG: hypothetical protein CMP10_11235 [Zetaproteobacteria bacterium]|nr:hypothetical protein [Pseudobdellovibrionaceae bacterium]